MKPAPPVTSALTPGPRWALAIAAPTAQVRGATRGGDRDSPGRDSVPPRAMRQLPDRGDPARRHPGSAPFLDRDRPAHPQTTYRVARRIRASGAPIGAAGGVYESPRAIRPWLRSHEASC